MAGTSIRTHATRSLSLSVRRAALIANAKLRYAGLEAKQDLRDLGRALSPARQLAAIRSFGPRWVLNIAVAGIVLSLPFAASAAATAPVAGGGVAVAAAQRATTVSRGGTIAAGRSPVTVNAEGVRPVVEYTLGANDTLTSLANFFDVTPEAIAYANGITDPRLEVGRTIRIPPGKGALFTVAEGDTVESVAARFKVEPAVIRDYNRLHFEPEHFAPGKLVFVPGAELPAVVVVAADPEIERPTTRLAPAGAPQRAAVAPAGDGSFAWPVRGYVTQYFWAGHTGIDIAAPYGTTIVASAPGTVTAVGWVPVGGLRVCVTTADGIEACSYHTAAVFVGVGQLVERGQAIASIGMTGVTTGPHVHFEVKRGGAFVNPLSLLK
ncbi:MAG TPA: M23 family metallopeptidase [Candidatus Limnocylindria bacterium]|nr:M23 family metallopeptidase [Candidatus Limnocylindria bacterium]